MKKILFCVLIIIFAMEPVFAENLLDFSDLNGWETVNYNNDKACKISAEDGVLTISSPTDNHAYIWRNVPVESGKSYRFSAEISTKDVPDKENGALLGIYYKIAYSDEIRGTSDFIPVELYFRAEGTSVPVMLSLGGYSCMNSGAAYFRNIRIEKVDNVPEGAKYYEYTDNEGGKKDFDTKWILLCVLLVAVLSISFFFVYRKTERKV